MYEYTPKTDKKKEKLIFLGLLVIAAIFYVGSLLPFMPFPAVFQFVAFAALAVAIVVVSKFMICHYVYRIEPSETSPDGGMDFVITECVGKRKTVVCRVERSAIVSVTPITRENKKALADLHRGKDVYRYMGEMFAENRYLVKIEQYGAELYIYILSDEGLLTAISNH